MNSDSINANNFLIYLRKQNCIIPEDFIIKYYKLTKDNFVSISDCIDWLNVTRDNIVKTLKNSYNINIDFFEITYEEESNITKFGKQILNIKSNNKLFFKLTVDCFKKISMTSNSKIGKLTKTYFIEMERIVKDFSNKEMTRLQNENQKLKRNLNPIKISDKEGLYVWHYNDELKYRIGSGEELQRRINQHNSSHADDVFVDHYVETYCYKDFESIVLKFLDSKRYRKNKDFFDCDIKIIRMTIRTVNNLLLKINDNCQENNTLNNSKKTSKRTSKKTSKKISKKTSKKISKKTSKSL